MPSSFMKATSTSWNRLLVLTLLVVLCAFLLFQPARCDDFEEEEFDAGDDHDHGDDHESEYGDLERKDKKKGDCNLHAKEKIIAIEKVVKVPRVTVIEHEKKKKKKKKRRQPKFDYYK